MKMKKYLFALSLGFGGLIWATQQAQAQQARCAERKVVVERLEQKYGETRRSLGIGRNNAVVEVFASDETRTWTILVSLPNGMSCLVASGESWEQLATHRIIPGSGA
ncbi:MAG: hypothetical protein ACE5DK_07415 [Paracoccaceae bacterium]